MAVDRSPGTAEIDLALARGVVYEALALALSPPSADALARLGGPRGRTIALAAGLTGSIDRARLEAVCRTFSSAAGDPLPGLAARHQALFGHTARGEVCPFETEYGAAAAFRQPHELADIAGYYRAFGLVPGATLDTRIDHVACECAFMAFLARKEAVWLAEPQADPSGADTDTLGVTRDASRTFLRDHLARFGLAFAQRLGEADAGGFYGAAADLLRAWLVAECARLEVAHGPALLELRTGDDDAVPAACGDCGTCASA